MFSMWIFPLVGSTFLVHQKCSCFKLRKNSYTYSQQFPLRTIDKNVFSLLIRLLELKIMSINFVCPPSVSSGAAEIEKKKRKTQRNPAATPCEVWSGNPYRDYSKLKPNTVRNLSPQRFRISWHANAHTKHAHMHLRTRDHTDKNIKKLNHLTHTKVLNAKL